jgi:hypothetical protein
MQTPHTEVVIRHDSTELARVVFPPGEYVIGRSSLHSRESRQHRRTARPEKAPAALDGMGHRLRRPDADGGGILEFWKEYDAARK